MSGFRKYMHVEKFGNKPVLGIEMGRCHVFPKLDGTNASLWFENGELQGGSRNRLLSIENDNAGFLQACRNEPKFYEFFKRHPNTRLYGEWLVPHTLKTYRDNVWRRFWVFDVYQDDTETFVPYDDYQPVLKEFDLDYIAPMGVISNGTYESFIHYLNQNNLFIKDGEGIGEGIVIKNYDFINQFGHQIWSKIVASEFKEMNHKEFGPPTKEVRMVEEEIAREFVTEALCTKNYAKINNDNDGWESKFIPELLGRVYYDIITEEMWNILQKHKNVTINFGTLRSFVTKEIKMHLPEVF